MPSSGKGPACDREKVFLTVAEPSRVLVPSIETVKHNAPAFRFKLDVPRFAGLESCSGVRDVTVHRFEPLANINRTLDG